MAASDKLPLASKSITAAGQVDIIDLNTLPADKELIGFIFEISATGTAAASTQAVTATTLAQVLAKIQIDTRFLEVNATGRMLHVMAKLMTGYSLANASQTVTTTTGGEAVKCILPLMLRDPRARRPSDFAIPCQLLRDKSIQIQAFSGVGGALVLNLTNDVTLTNLIIRPYALVQPLKYLRIPSKTKIAYEDFSAVRHRIQSVGKYSYAALYDESDLAVTLAEYTQVSMEADNEKVLDRIRTPALVAGWNEFHAEAAADQLSYIESASNEFIPLYTPPKHYSIVKLPESGGGGLELEIESGSATSGRVAYRQVRPATQDDHDEAAILFGKAPGQEELLSLETAGGEVDGSDEGLMDVMAQYLPKRIAQ